MEALVVSILALGLYAIVILSIALSLLAVIFAYRLSKITGLFGAWTMLIAALALTAIEDFFFSGSVIFSGYSKVQNLVEKGTADTFVFTGLFLLAIPALYFGAMYLLYGMFKSQSSKQAKPTPLTTEIS
jgi:hypothetical protein